MQQIIFNKDYTVTLFCPAQSKPVPIIWLHTSSGKEGEAIFSNLHKECALACVECADWNGELSPWPAEAITAQGSAFAGNASKHLKLLTEKIIPKVEEALPFTVTYRGLAGYSMAGLFTAYALYQTDLFQLAGSMSGSFWYDGFYEYAVSHETVARDIPFYISLGNREHRVKNPRMSCVNTCTEKLADYWKKRFQVVYEVNSGGHFNQPAFRVAKGIDWLLSKI